ncbi:RNI-like protein [Coniochaeta ligniaria NRRL 30616]|uniref:RNI-like protein n=1 Tax=Coniochaeta ligniaria NRRL 30616 TaxID=1408157 RepID=A0A1J7JWZ5_9PEZI|nr:RNI-like protein [Coniochaeta ligniaria NRRL 30616]
MGRSRSASAGSRPYGAPGSLSCVSLASSPSPFGQPSSGSYFNYASQFEYNSSAATSVAGTPMAEVIPVYHHIEGVLAVRKLDTAAAAAGTVPTTVALPADLRFKRRSFQLWASMPHEIKIYVLAFLQPKELVRASRVSKEFYKNCFDGQLWTCFDASEFYKDIPAESLAKIILAAGPFVKDLNLRGCVQVEHYKRAEVMVKACKNLMTATLEGCRNFQRNTLHNLLKSNVKLAHLNLTGLTAVTNTTCKIIAQSCTQLEMFNVSWCKHMDARGIKAVVEGCPKLKDLRAGEIRGFDNTDVALALFKTNNLERLVLSGCEELTDGALRTILYGRDPEIDILYDRPIVPARRLRHLDLSRCTRLTNHGVSALGHFVPDLEGLQLAGISALTDSALEPILASTPRLTHLELEDLNHLTNSLLSEHLAKAPCAPILTHLSVSYCEAIGDSGMLPLIRACHSLRSIDADNTRISDLSLAEAASMVRKRSLAPLTQKNRRPPVSVGLSMVVYDCPHVTWTGAREVLNRNAEANTKPVGGLYPTEIISLRCFYGWQMTVDEHTKRVLRGDSQAACRLERKWADYMQANEEAGVAGAGGRRRRRRAREAQLVHANEEDGGVVVGGRRRARTAACLVM